MLTAVVVSALGLAACGSDSEGDEETTSASATSSSESAGSSAPSETSAGSEESQDPSASESAPESEPEAEPESEAPEEDPAQDNPDNPDNPDNAGNAANQAQRQGAPASGDDASQIRGVSEGLAGDRSYAEYMQYVYDTTCTADIDRLGGRDSYRQQIEEARKENKQWSEVAGEGNIPTVHGVNDIQVQGDRATANVDRTIGGNRGSEVVTYVREDGGWKTCANA